MGEVKVTVFRRGKGPIDEFTTKLGGWDQNQLEVGEILDRYGFKCVYAFNRDLSRGVPIRFHPRNRRSLLSYAHKSEIYLDGEPKDSMLKPITKILLGVMFMTLLISVVIKEKPRWINKYGFKWMGFPPWVLACVVIVFTCMRKHTLFFFRKFGFLW